MSHIRKTLFSLGLMLSLSRFCFAGTVSYQPPQGYVPDEETAKAIAEAVWTPIYGKQVIEKEKPFHAVLKDSIWTVTGTLHCPENRDCLGGAAEIDIAKDNGEILRVIHTM